jgi:predicted MFS family arabinose efflux permease
VTDNRLTVWIGVTAGSLLGAIITRNLMGAAVALACGVFLVVLSLVVNGALDWWEDRRGTGA